jgi:serine/threonine protein kinase
MGALQEGLPPVVCCLCDALERDSLEQGPTSVYGEAPAHARGPLPRRPAPPPIPSYSEMRRRAKHDTPSTVTIDGYADLVRIGAGGFSVVYRASEPALHRTVAVKVLNSGLTTDSERAVFERECRALGQLDHPDIVRVYRSAYTTDDRPCIVMELYDGNLRDVLSTNGPLPADELLDTGVRMAVALHVAHGKGVLHRDVKPHNIFRSRYGDPALGDFGIATVIGERTHSGPTGLSIAYAAPELLNEAPIGPATDVYALAATLHHLATGSAPFAASDVRVAVRKILSEQPPSIDRADLPHGFERALRRALAKNPAQRPSSALEFAEMLREVQARGGFTQSPIKLELGHEGRRDAGAAAPNAGQPRANTSSPRGAPTAATASIPSGRERHDDVSSAATVVRPRPAKAPEPTPAQPRSTQRTLIAAGVLVAAVAALGLGIAAFQGGDDAPTASTTATAPPIDTFVGSIAAPSSATITVGPGPDTFVVDVGRVDGAARYVITPVGSTATPVAVAAAELPATLTLPGVVKPCVIIEAISDTGRQSASSPAFCL